MPASDFDVTGSNDARFVTIRALRDGGRFARAHELAAAAARDGSDAAQRIQALCVQAELETEAGIVAKSRCTVAEARSLLVDVAGGRVRGLLGAICDIVEFEASHCQGETPSDALEKSSSNACGGAPSIEATRSCSSEPWSANVDPFQCDEGARALDAITEASFRCYASRARRHADRPSILRFGPPGARASSGSSLVSPRRDMRRSSTSAGEKVTRGRCAWACQMMAAHLLTLGRIEELVCLHRKLGVDRSLRKHPRSPDRAFEPRANRNCHRGDGMAALRWVAMADDLHCDAFSITQASAISHAEALQLLGQADRAAVLYESLLRSRAKVASPAGPSQAGRSDRAFVAEARARSARPQRRGRRVLARNRRPAPPLARPRPQREAYRQRRIEGRFARAASRTSHVILSGGASWHVILSGGARSAPQSKDERSAQNEHGARNHGRKRWDGDDFDGGKIEDDRA